MDRLPVSRPASPPSPAVAADNVSDRAADRRRFEWPTPDRDHFERMMAASEAREREDRRRHDGGRAHAPV